MGIREAISGFMNGLTGSNKVADIRPPINATPGLGQIEVVDTSKLPTQSNVPGSWSRYWLGPGQPFSPTDDNARAKDKETEPRSFQYITGVNTTMMPRLAYGLAAFSDLRYYAESVPEVSMCVRLLTEEMKAFVPKIVALDGTEVKDTEYRWMCERPDKFNPFPVWLSRFLYNVLVYDAGCGYRVRNSRHKITASRVIDGSTIFIVIDERGEQPAPPAPAFQQVIWGVPKMFLNRNQLWYKPRHLRADAPYGRSPIEDSLPAVKLLSSLWEYEYEKYQVGNIPEMVFTAPENWKDSVDQILNFEDTFNARMTGNSAERVRARFMPAGVQALQTKELDFNKESYDAATNAVRMSFGIIQSEVGEGPSAGLGGKGYAEAMQSAFYRMGLAPLISYTESHFNDILKENGENNIQFKLEFPPESLDPQKEEEKYSTRFQIGGIKRDEYRQGIGMEPLGGEEGEFLVSPSSGNGEDDGGDPFGSLLGGDNKPGGKPGLINVRNRNNVQVRRPIHVAKEPVQVLGTPVNVHKGDGAEDASPKSEQLNLQALGERLGVDWDVVDPGEFAMGVKEEREHLGSVAQSIEDVAQIALDHLQEDSQYYSKLREKFGKFTVDSLKKYCGVDPEDDILFGSPVTDHENVDMPHQGANGSKIVSIGGGQLDARPAVWKPSDEENPKLVNWVHGPLYRRSEAAYLLDRELAPDENHYLVPVTYITSIDETEGSVQHYVLARRPRKSVEQYAIGFIEQAAVLDYVMGQVDRVDKNYLTHPHKDDRPVLIDNDLSFSPDPNQHIRSSFVSFMAGKPLSEKMLDSVYTALGNHDLWDDLQSCLDDADAVANARARAERILQAKSIPDPDKTTGFKKPVKIVKVEEPTDLQKSVGKENGSMVAIDIPVEISNSLVDKISWPDKSEILPASELHITLAFLGDTPDLNYDKQKLWSAVRGFVVDKNPFSGKINGVGRFLESHKEGMNCIYANFDSPELPDFRALLVDWLNQSECPVKENHGFTPHITLAYIPSDSSTPDTSAIKPVGFEVKGIAAYWNDETEFFPFNSVEKLQKEDWEEEKHPRSQDGKFAPKGQGESGGGGGQQAPASERVGTSTYERAKRVAHRAQQVIDARHAQDAAGVGQKPASEKKPDNPGLKTQNALFRRDLYRKHGNNFLVHHAHARDGGEERLMSLARMAATKLEVHWQAVANHEQSGENVLTLDEKIKYKNIVLDGLDYIAAWEAGDGEKMNDIRLGHGLPLIPLKRPTPAPVPKPAGKDEVKFPPRPANDDPGGNKLLVKNPERFHAHFDTPEKIAAIKELKDFTMRNPNNVMEGATHIELYGKICQSGSDFDHINAIIHVQGGLTEYQKKINNGDMFPLAGNGSVTFVNDFNESDARWVEKIRRDNRDQRLGHTSIHELHRQFAGGGISWTVAQPQTEGGTHGTEAAKLKANPGAHIWDKKDKLKNPANAVGAGAGAAVPVVGMETHINARKLTNESKRAVLHNFASGEIVTRKQNGERGINSSYWIKIKDDGEGLMKPADTNNKLSYGMPETDAVASDLAESMGFTCVPVTGYRKDKQDGKCSVMQKAEGNIEVAAKYNGPVLDSDVARDTASQMLVLTTITGNTDRHSNNFMVNKDTGEFIAIDNGFSCLMVNGDRWAGGNAEADAEKRADRAFERATKHISRDTEVKGLVVYQKHVDAAEAFVNSPECERVLAAHFSGPEFCTNMRKYGVGYLRDMTDEQVSQRAVGLAKTQLVKGLQIIKQHIGEV